MDELVDRVYEKVLAKLGEGPDSLVVPFSLYRTKGVAYASKQASLEEIKKAISAEYDLIMAKDALPLTDCKIKPSEITLRLATGKVLTERDQLSLILANAKPTQDLDFVIVDTNTRKLRLYGAGLQPLLQQDFVLPDEPAGFNDIPVHVHYDLAQLIRVHEWCAKEKFQVFEQKSTEVYECRALCVRDLRTKETTVIQLASIPLLYSLAENENFQVFPLFTVALKPEWTFFFEHFTEKGELGQECHFLRFTEPKTIQWFKEFLGLPELYSSQPAVSCNTLIRLIADIKAYSNYPVGVDWAVKWLEPRYDELLGPIKSMIAEGNISYDALWYYFPKNTRLAIREGKSWILVTANRTFYKKVGEKSFFKIYFQLMNSNGRVFYKRDADMTINEFKGVVPLNSLEVRKPDTIANVEAICEKQFTQFEKYATGIHQVNCDGFVQTIGSRVLAAKVKRKIALNPNRTTFQFSGRGMVDLELFGQSGHLHPSLRIEPEPAEAFVLTKEDRQSVWPYLPFFSLATKTWFRVHCMDLSPIEFQDVIDKVVMPQLNKELIMLVAKESADRKVCDLTSGKNLGSCVLLYGPPGTGKTLTCEAVAERMQCPLYCVSIAELGNTASLVEQTLTAIFQVAARWSAILLIDEADIFLEKRSNSEIERNAMVGVFLRMLESNEGLLFLTTNHVEHFDSAIWDRMVLQQHYRPLDSAQRELVWRNLLEARGVDMRLFEPRIAELASEDRNGRDINRLVNIASMMASKAGESLGLLHLFGAINSTENDKRVDLVKSEKKRSSTFAESAARRQKIE